MNSGNWRCWLTWATLAVALPALSAGQGASGASPNPPQAQKSATAPKTNAAAPKRSPATPKKKADPVRDLAMQFLEASAAGAAKFDPPMRAAVLFVVGYAYGHADEKAK